LLLAVFTNIVNISLKKIHSQNTPFYSVLIAQ
jgi:hypothetical protein